MQTGSAICRCWHKPHGSTLVVFAILASALVYLQRDLRGDIISIENATYKPHTYYQGWPVICRKLMVIETGWTDPKTLRFTRTKTESHDEWLLAGLVLNVVSMVLIVASTALMWEHWRRRGTARWQFTIRAVLIALTAFVVLLLLHRHELSLHYWLSDIVNSPSATFPLSLAEFPWYVAGPIYAGIGCALYVVFATTSKATIRTFRKH